MKWLIVGLGDCGCRLASEFALLNKRAQVERGANIITTAYAANNDQDSLAALAKSRLEGLQTILIPGPLEGREKLAEAGAELMREQGDRLISLLKPGEFFRTDAFLFVAGAAGGVGSGGIPIIAQKLKERYVNKPLYALIVLPFESETSDPRCVYNTAICLKSTYKIADAVFLTDNEKYRLKGSAASIDDKGKVNKEIASTFYDLLCVNEMADPKYAGGKTASIGDIVQTLTGWTAIGTGKTQFSASKPLWGKTESFQDKGSETLKTLEALNAAFNNFPIDCRMEDAGKALYLLSTPVKESSIDMVRALGNRLREIAYNTEIRGGDFYGAKDFVQVTIVASDLSYVEKIKDYYDKAVDIAPNLRGEEKPA